MSRTNIAAIGGGVLVGLLGLCSGIARVSEAVAVLVAVACIGVIVASIVVLDMRNQL
jgi:uncharacterized membrane protein